MLEAYVRFLQRLAQGASWRDAHMQFWLDMRAFGVEVETPDGVFERGVTTGSPAWKSLLRVRELPCADGLYRVYFRGDPTPEEEQAVEFVLAADSLLHDHERLKQEATHDPLTGCLNRKGLQEWFERRQRRYNNLEFVLVLMDFDKFKCLNDTQGHAKGDEALCAIAQALQAEKRASDVLARLGGDEFVLIFEACACHEGMVDRLRQLKARLPLEQYGLDITFGTACFPKHGETLEQLLAHADLHLYHGKHRGGGEIVWGDSAHGGA
ncbi:GGDEF domain-containing protein [Alicyclobacillus acidocaldarius]|uniref:Diguanylate cyclase n=1 Tax=Alicyclobacillus acidocaldarius (strain Tc-4-1) TaxID=1048834 RepID=F8IGM9_ALIAT|nr:GGDEF domain-containing protein [Alicyclobacillus acidocaldarius]AEJ44309.1 diguanylate cyclase [Alicyclobacillus acidocaldarius subsp. acidocaldarius Tc-4-1]